MVRGGIWCGLGFWIRLRFLTRAYVLSLAFSFPPGAFHVSDAEALSMLSRLLREDGLFLGSSSGVNCTAALKLARQLGPGHVIVTILCDSGERYVSKLYNGGVGERESTVE